MPYLLTDEPWVPCVPIPTHVPKSCGVCWQSFPPFPYVWSSVPTSWNNCLSKEYLHRGPIQESSLPHGQGSNGRASRQSPYLHIAASAVPASRLIQHQGGW